MARLWTDSKEEITGTADKQAEFNTPELQSFFGDTKLLAEVVDCIIDFGEFFSVVTGAGKALWDDLACVICVQLKVSRETL